MRKVTFAQALNEAVKEEFRRDPNVFAIGEELGYSFNGTFEGIVEEFGKDRGVTTPISEEGFVGLAVGAAVAGKRPIVELMFSNFLGVCFDQILNQAPKMHYMFGGQAKVPMVIVAVTGSRGSGAGQHSDTAYPWLMNIPGLKVVYPSNGYDAKGLFKTAVRDNNPVVFLVGASLSTTMCEIPDEGEELLVPIGKAKVVREGKDMTVVAVGHMVDMALKVAEDYKDQLSIEVVDPRSITPLDTETIVQSVAKTGKLIIAEDCWPTANLGSEISYVVSNRIFDKLKAPIQKVARENVPMPFSACLERVVMASEEKLVAAVEAIK